MGRVKDMEMRGEIKGSRDKGQVEEKGRKRRENNEEMS